MRKNKSLQRLCSIAMTLALLVGMLSVMGSLPAVAAETTTAPLNSTLSFPIGGTNAANVNTVDENSYAVYSFTEPTGTDKLGTTWGPKQIGANMTYRPSGGGNGLVGFSDISTGYEWGAVTCVEKAVTDFSATLTYYPTGNEDATSPWYMGIMVAEKGNFALSLDGNNANDTGILVTASFGNTFNVAGAIKEDGYAYAPANGFTSSGNYMKNKVANWRGQLNNNPEPSSSNNANYPSGKNWTNITATDAILYTITVQVKGKYLTVWNHATPHLKTVVELSDNYAGGHVSFVQHGTKAHGTIKSLTVTDVVYDAECSVELNGAISAQMDEDFKVFKFNNPTTVAATAAVSHIPAKPSVAMTTGESGTYGNGLLDFAELPTNGYGALTYTKKRFTDFSVTYTYYPNATGYMGIMVGEMGQFGVSMDKSSANDTGLFISVEKAGQTNVSGALDNLDTARDAAGTKVTSKDSNIGSLVTNVRFYITDDSTEANTEANLTADSVLQTVTIEAKNGILRIWNHRFPEKAVTVSLGTKYAGGYISFVKNITASGSLKSMTITELFPEHDVTNKVAYPMIKGDSKYIQKLDKDFEVYHFNSGEMTPTTTAKATTTDKKRPSEDSALHISTINYSTGWLNFTKRTNQWEVLTYKEKVTNFRAEVTLYPAYAEMGVFISPQKGVLPVTADKNHDNDNGLFIRMQTEGHLTVYGAVNFDAIAGAAKARIDSGEKFSSTSTSQWFKLSKPNSLVNAAKYTDGYYKPQDKANANKKENAFNLVIEVKHNTLSVHLKGHEELGICVPLSSKYQGGYISFGTYNSANQGMADFAITEYYDNEYSTDYWNSATASAQSLDNDFSYNAFSAFGGDMAPQNAAQATAFYTANPSDKQDGSKLNVNKGETGTGRGWWAFTKPSGATALALTYTKERVTDFVMEYNFMTAYSQTGMMFGAEEGKMPYTADKKFYNDTGVAVWIESQGQLNIVGAIDLSTLSAADRERITETGTGLFGNLVDKETTSSTTVTHLRLPAPSETDNKAIASVGSLVTPANYTNALKFFNTMVVQVKDRVLTVYMRGDEDLAFSVGLADTYQGGYVSLVNKNNNGSYKGFSFGSLSGQEIVAVDGENDYTVQVNTKEGYEVEAGSFYATDENGNSYVPTRVGFREGGNASKFYFEGVPADAVLAYHSKYVQPSTTAPNIGNVGTSINTSKNGLRFVSRLGVVQNGDAFYATLGGKQYTVEKIGMLISTEAGLNHSSQNGHEFVVGVDNKYVKDVLIHDANATHTDIYFDVCDSYTDVSVCVLGLGNYPTMPVVARAYVVINIDGQAQTFYTDVVTDQYTRT